jgi:hypothetical protein
VPRADERVTNMAKQREKLPAPHPGHRLVTRRDFLGQGLVAGMGFVMAPSLLGLLGGSRASAQAAAACGIATGGAGRIPFVCFDLSGGANLAGSNVLVGGPGGQLDPLDAEGYEKLGLPSDQLPQLQGQVSNELGLLFHSDSALLRGILSKTSAATRARVNGSVLCARSENDTGNNPHNPMYGINKAGADGDLVALIGTRSSDSGGNSQAPMSMLDPSKRPTRVADGGDARGLVDTGKLVELLSQQDAVAVMQAVEQISALEVARLTEDQIVKDLIGCGYTQSVGLVERYGNPNLLDPALDADVTGAGNSIFSGAEFGRGDFERTAAVMKLVVNGFAGAGTVELGGYDYHDGTRATGERRDFTAGQAIGAVLEYAARKGQQVMVYVFSDGSVASDGEIDDSADGRGKGVWRGDNSSTAASLMLVYDPAGRPALARPEAAQLGHFRPNGSVEDRAARFAGNVDLLAETVVLNYLALHDEVARFAQVLPRHGLGAAAELDALVAFQPIR